MGYGQVAYSYSSVSYYSKPQRRVSPQNVIGASALAFVSLTCLGMLAVNLFGDDDTAADTGAEIVTIAQPRSLEAGGMISSLLSSAYSLNGPRVSFEVPALAKGDKLEVAALAKGDRLAVRALEKPQQAAELEMPQAELQNDTSSNDAPLANAQPTQTMQVVANIPLPPPRPAIEPVQSKAATQTKLPEPRDIVQADKPAMLANAVPSPKPNKALTIFEKLFGKRERPEKTQLAYASSDAGVTGSIPTNTSDIAAGMTPPYDRQTAVYDITARTVYLPDGTRLEAHSGLGSRLDDPRSMRERMRGVTPPHVYDLTLRESLFHGVEALRLNPIGGEEAIFGRTGLLAHTYMLGPNGDSNGCVSFRDYNRFLRAYKNGDIKRLVVVAKVD